MTTASGKVYDVGYKPYEGAHDGPMAVVRTIAYDTIRRAMGIRRRGRSKVIPWLLVAGTTLPALFTLVIMFFTGQSPFATGADPMADNSALFESLVVMSLIFVAFVGPTALIPDRRDGVMNIYASRPVRTRDYLLGRASGICALVVFFMLVPQVLLLVGQAALHPDGIFAGATALAVHVPGLIGAIGAAAIALVAPVFLISLYSKRTGAATGMFMVAMIALDGVSELVREEGLSDNKILALASPLENFLAVRDWMISFSADGVVAPGHLGADLPNWAGGLVILGVAVVTGLLARRRYRKELGA